MENKRPPFGTKRPAPPPPPPPRNPNGSIDEPMLELDGDRKKGKVEKRKLLEKDIERPVCRYARDIHQMKAEKFTSPGRRAVPDDIFSKRGGDVFFIEFKAPGKVATPMQEKDHTERRRMGFRVYVVDDIEQGKKIIDKESTQSTHCDLRQ